MELHLTGILIAYGVLALGIFSPGPAVFAIMGTALERGRSQAIWLALGVACGSATWGVLAAFGFASILTTSVTALTILKVAGGFYLLYLAWKNLRATLSLDGGTIESRPVDARSARRMWATGLLIHLTNPKAVLAWLATVALGMSASSPWWVALVIVAGGAVISVVGNLSYAFAFSTPIMVRAYTRARRPIGFALSAMLGAAGLRLLTDRS